MSRSNYLFLVLISLAVVVSLPVNAGFLDMPEISETPELERKSMLRDIDIPGVKDRDPDPTAGPRLAVKEFRVQGLVEYPELGITKKAINKLVEKIRFDLMSEDKLLDSGYTIDELGGLSDLLVDIEEDTVKRHVTPIEVQKLVWLIRDQRKRRGITLGQIESIADTITKFYRERGFILAKAYIPKQEVRDGIVTLTLLLGLLGSVDVVNNDMYSTSSIRSVFDSMLAKPVTSQQVEENLYLINDFPGLIVNGYFSPGYQVGDTKLNINVKKEERFNSNIRLDNHGTEGTGLYRSFIDFQVNNPLGISDLLNVSTLNASEPNNTRYWRVFYQTNIYSPRWKFMYSQSTNQFLVDKSAIDTTVDIEGVVDVLDYGFRYDLQRSRVKNSRIELIYEEVISDLKVGKVNTRSQDEEIEGFTLAYYFDFLNEKERSLHQGAINLTNNEITFGGEPTQAKQFTFLTVDYSLLSFVKVPFFDSNSRLITRANLQYGGQKISSIKRSPIAGPLRARGYFSDIFSADDSLFLAADWVFNAPDIFDFNLFTDANFKDIAKPFIFIDLSYGKQYQLEADSITGQIADVGIGLQFAYRDKFSGNLQVAFPFGDEFSDPDLVLKDNGAKIIFDFQYKF